MNTKPTEARTFWRGALTLIVFATLGGANACGEGVTTPPSSRGGGGGWAAAGGAAPTTTVPPFQPTSTGPTATPTQTPTSTPTATTTTTTTSTTTAPVDAGPVCPAPKCEEYTGDPIIPDLTVLPACNDPALPLCSDGRCVPTAAVPAESAALLHPCDDANLCVPEEFILKNSPADGPQFLSRKCRSLDDAEGRCLSLCIPQVASQADFLPQDICEDTQKCAPCYDPRTGESTGACDQGCDGGPCEPPVTFDRCCGGIGSCVPTSAVPEADRDLLGPETCTGTDRLCAPDALASSTFVPATCRSVANAEGRCLPDCIPQVAAQASLLPQDTCATGELCAPCFDPVGGGSTGACERNGDAPTEDPVLFEDCCNTEGSCVPTDVLSADQLTQLGQDSCADGNLCAPKVFAGPGLRAETCRSIDTAEGRCLPLCVPLVEAQSDRLPQDVCVDGQLCAPCFDPITGEDTSACSQNGDQPVNPPYTFPKCCSGIGACVPTTLVPAAQQTLLGKDTCTGTGVLCAPSALTDPTATPKTCRSFGIQNREGRCLAACIPQVADRAAQLQQEDCASGELCTPCYDPVTGESTGACEVNGDAPVDANPGAFLTCGAVNVFCLTCPSCDGRCVPDYLAGSNAANLPSGADLPAPCVAGELCAPCMNPLDGTLTGACPAGGGACP